MTSDSAPCGRKEEVMLTRDEIAWKSIHDRPVVKMGPDQGWRSRSYADLESRLQLGQDWDTIWSDFLHAFYDHRDASFFAHPSPASLPVEMQAWLAGVAEFLSADFHLPHPVWTDDSRYFLSASWDPWEEAVGLDMSAFRVEKVARSPEAFRKRNIAYLSRGLIAV